MAKHATAGTCRLHRWVRRMETRNDADCVVRVCTRCGEKELCWSRSPLTRRRRALLQERIEQRAGAGLAGAN